MLRMWHYQTPSSELIEDYQLFIPDFQKQNIYKIIQIITFFFKNFAL